jgi:hypothetical protein
MTLTELLERTVETPDGCLEWTGWRKGGYGRIVVDGKRLSVHRLAFWLTHGYWPNICRHTCDNPPCCNPDHLLDGTHADNTRDALERGLVPSYSVNQTHCIRGHEVAGDNLYVSPSGRKACRACNAWHQKRWRDTTKGVRLVGAPHSSEAPASPSSGAAVANEPALEGATRP